MTRDLFPRGLIQPEGAYRFGLEALLLAAFAAQTLRERAPRKGGHREMTVAELGSGCGAALLGVALRRPDARCLGLELEPSLVLAAAANARALGLAERVRFRVADVAAPTELTALEKDTAPQDLVLANPPWGQPGRGHPSPSTLREAALRGTIVSKPTLDDGRCDAPAGDAFPIFCVAAARLLRHRGAFCCIVPTQALTRICSALEAARLGLRRILPLRPHTRKPAHRLLLLAQKDATAEPQLLAPLTLHAHAATKRGENAPGWTRAALAFCPWLATKPGLHPGTPDTASRPIPRGTP